MYISDIDFIKQAAKTSSVYLLISLFCALFGAVYEMFSHEVYSFYMIYAFVFPLAGGALPFLILSILLFHIRWYPGTIGRNLYHSGIATLTVGSIVQGILDIYGTTNRLTRIDWYMGISLLVAGMTLAFIKPVTVGHSKQSG